MAGALIREVSAWAPRPALRFIGHQQRIVAVGKLPGLRHVLRRQRVDAAFALDHFEHDRRRALAERRFQRRDVVRRHEARARHQRFEILAVLGLPRDRERAERPSVEGIVQRDHLVLIRVNRAPVRVRHLERALHRLRPGIAEEAALQPAHLRQPFGQRALILVVIEVGSMQQEARLRADDFGDPRMRVAQRVDTDPGDQVQVSLAREVVEIAALTAGQHERITRIILQQIFALQVHDRLGESVLNRGQGSRHFPIIARPHSPSQSYMPVSRSFAYLCSSADPCCSSKKGRIGRGPVGESQRHLSQRRKDRKVGQKWLFFASFAPLREIFFRALHRTSTASGG